MAADEAFDPAAPPVLRPRAKLRQIAIGALFLLGIGAGVRLALLFVDNPTTGTMLGAMLVAFVVGQAGLVAEDGGAAARKRGAVAAGMVAAVVAIAAGSSVLLGATLRFVPPTTSALFGIAEAIAVGYIAEAWLHGLPLLFAKRADVPEPMAIGYAVAAGVGAELFTGPRDPAGVTLAMLSGLFFVLLWVKTRDAWAPVTAHAVYVWSTDALLSGDLLDLGSQTGRLSHTLGAHGPGTWIAAAGFGVLSWLVASGMIRFTPATFPAPSKDDDDDEDDDEDDADVEDEDDAAEDENDEDEPVDDSADDDGDDEG